MPAMFPPALPRLANCQEWPTAASRNASCSSGGLFIFVMASNLVLHHRVLAEVSGLKCYKALSLLVKSH